MMRARVTVRASRMAMGALAAAMAADGGGERTQSEGRGVVRRLARPVRASEREIGSDLRTGRGGTNGAEKMDGIFSSGVSVGSLFAH